MTTPPHEGHGADFVPPSLPTVYRRTNPAPLDEREQLIAQVLTELMRLDDSHSLGRDTLELIETLPWEQVRLLRDRLAAT